MAAMIRYIFGPTPLRMWINIMQSRDDARVAAAKVAP